MGRVRELYDQRVRRGELERDPAQEEAVARLDGVADELAKASVVSAGPLEWLFGSRRPAPGPRGLYIYGPVGRGKTMLMDLFFQSVDEERKRRAHFHVFMAEAHARIHDWRGRRKLGQVRGEDPIAPVAEQLSAEARLLCFDEFAVTDIADAMVLGRLFTRLFELGTVLVATSNVAPSRLYDGGLNRALFLPFIALLEERVESFELRARTDFRLEKLAGLRSWIVPANAGAAAALDRAFLALTGCGRGEPATLCVGGRDLVVPEAAHDVARFTFRDICEQPLGPSDYLEIARRFHTVLIDGVPAMGPEKRNEARRFIWLIDALYEMKVKLLASAEAEPDELYLARQGIEAFEFARAASRLIEMRSQDYLASPHGAASAASGDVTGLVET